MRPTGSVLGVLILGTFSIVLSMAQPAAAKDDLPYPWCALKGDPECTFMTLQQCEESANGRGICEANPYLSDRDEGAGQRGR